ncbi:dynein light chain binding protein [Aureococcus anophagefferens]|nr:dynein light chain binding protein [Aureococcus anophagefferens]
MQRNGSASDVLDKARRAATSSQGRSLKRSETAPQPLQPLYGVADTLLHTFPTLKRSAVLDETPKGTPRGAKKLKDRKKFRPTATAAALAPSGEALRRVSYEQAAVATRRKANTVFSMTPQALVQLVPGPAEVTSLVDWRWEATCVLPEPLPPRARVLLRADDGSVERGAPHADGRAPGPEPPGGPKEEDDDDASEGAALSDDDDDERTRGDYAAERNFEQDPLNENDADSLFEAGVRRDYMYLCPAAARTRKKALRAMGAARDAAKSKALKVSEPAAGRPLIEQPKKLTARARRVTEEKKKSQGLMRAIDIGVFEKKQVLQNDRAAQFLEQCVDRAANAVQRARDAAWTLVRRDDEARAKREEELAIARGGGIGASGGAAHRKDQSISEEKREKEERAKLRDQERDEKVLVGSLVMLADVVVTESLAIACASMGTTFRERLERSRETNQGMFEVQLSFAPPALGVEEASVAARGLSDPKFKGGLHEKHAQSEPGEKEASPDWTDEDWTANAGGISADMVAKAVETMDPACASADASADAREDARLAEERRDTGGTVFTPNCTEVRETASFVVHGAVEVVDNIVSIKSMWPFCDDLRASKAGDAAAMASRARGDSERRIHKAWLEAAEAVERENAERIKRRDARRRARERLQKEGVAAPALDDGASGGGDSRGSGGGGLGRGTDAGELVAGREPPRGAPPTPGTPPGSAGVADTTLHGGDGDGDIYMQSLEDSFRPNSRQSNGAVARIMRTKKAFQRDLKAIDREIRESFHEGTTYARSLDALRSVFDSVEVRSPAPAEDSEEFGVLLKRHARKPHSWRYLAVTAATDARAVARDAARLCRWRLELSRAQPRGACGSIECVTRKLRQRLAQMARARRAAIRSAARRCARFHALVAISAFRTARGLLDEQPQVLRAYAKHAATVVSTRAFGWSALHAIAKAAKRVAELTASEAIASDAFDPTVAGEDMMGLEEKEAEQKQLALLLGDDAQKLSFETKLYLTELRDEEKSQKRAELAHISWRTGRLRSAHQEVDSEVHKCGNQAASLARALSGPRFAAAEDDRYGEPVRVLDDMDGQRRKLQNVEEWRQKLVDLRALLDFIAQCELPEAHPVDAATNCSVRADPVDCSSDDDVLGDPLVDFGRSQLLWTMPRAHEVVIDEELDATSTALATGREAQIELSIHALDAAWEATVLPVLKIDLNEHNSSSSDDASTSSDEPPPAGTNGEPAAPDTIYELGPLDDVANLANDHRAAFRAIAMGEHGMALKPLITVWRQRLDRLTDALRAADDLDRKQRALKPMLAGEREGALAHAWARFNNGSQTLSHVVLALPALFDAVVTLDRSLEPESDGDANSANSSEKGGRPGSSESSSAPKGAMSMLLGNLKEARPSLSDAEKRRKRSERKASKRRSGRKSATGRRRQKPQKIGALVDAHGERLILPNPVEVYGGVEVWLRELEREMREALRASFAAVVRRQRQEKKRSKRRTSRSPEAVAPCQITLLCERMRWTEDVGDALSTSFRRGSCEPCDECFAKYRDEAERKARAIREGAVRLAPGEEPPEFRDDERARRSGDEALVLLALQHRDVADDVARAAPHMRGLDDYAWQSKLRFYPAGTLEARSRMSKIGGHIGRRTSEMIVPTAASGSATKSGSDLCSDLGVVARQMNAVLPVGVEYVGSAPRTVVTPLGARCVLGLTTAIQALRGVAVVGPHGVGKAEICKDLANTLMSRCVSRAPSDFGTQHENAVKAINHMFAGTARDGRLLMGAVAMRANTVKFAGKDVPLKSFVRSGSEKGETDEDYVSYSGMPLIAVTVSPPRGVSPLNHSIAMILRPVVLAAPDVASVVAGTLDTELGERSDGAKGAQLQARWGLRTAMSVVKEADAILRTGDLVSMRRPFQSNQETEAEDERQERAALAMAAKRMLLRSLRNSGDDEATMTELIRRCSSDARPSATASRSRSRTARTPRPEPSRTGSTSSRAGRRRRRSSRPRSPSATPRPSRRASPSSARGLRQVDGAPRGGAAADVPTRVLYVAPGALNLEDCFGGSSGSSGCLVSRFSQLAGQRAAAGGGDAWVVLDGNVERHWTEDLTVQLDRIADRADHGASPRRAACRVLLETDALADSSPSMVSRVGVVHLCGFSLPYEGCDKPCAKRAAAWVARNLRPKLSGTATLVAVADALDDLLEDCPLDDAIGLARRLDERRYFGFEYALEAKFDDDAPELPQHSSARWGAADDDARRLHACLVLVAALLLPSAGSDLEIIGDDAAVAAGAAKIAKCALAWGLAWGVLGTTLALGESEPGLARHLAGDAARWLRKAFGGDALEKDAPLWGARARAAADLFAFAKWETLAALRMEAFEVASPAAPRSPKDLEALHVPTPRDERVLFVLRSLLRGGVDAEPASWAPDDDDPDGSQRARGVALIEAYERGAGASAVAAAFAARELATAGGAGHVGARVASTSTGTLLRNVLAKRLVGHRRRHAEAAASDDLERSLLVAPEKAGASAGRRLLVVVDDVSVPLSTRDCPDYLRARHGTVDESHGHQAVDARGRRHLPPVAVAPPNRAELGAVFCGVVKASLVDRTRRGLDKDLEAAAGQALRVYVRMARFSRDRRAAHPPAPLCVWVRVAKGLRLLPSCHTTLSLRRGIAHELCRELRDGLVAAARPAFDAAVELEGLVPTDDLLVDDADPAVYGAPNAPVKHYSLVERDRKFTRAMREDAGHVSGHGANDRYNDDLDGEADVSDDEEPTLCNRCAFAQRLFDAAADDAGRPPSALAATGHARNVARAARALSAGTVLVQVGERGVGRRSVVDVAAHLCRYEHVFHSPPPPVFSSADAATYQVDGRGCGAVVAASREKNGVRAGRDPDTTWNEVIRRALFAAGGGEPTVVVIADSQWAHSGVTARRLDDLFSAVHTGTVADSRVFRPDDEARVVSDYLDAQIGAQGGNALAAAGARGGAQAGGNHVEVALAEYAARVRTHLRVVVCCCESDLAPIAGDSNCAHPAARRALAAVLPYAAVDRFDDPDEAGCEAAARRWLGVERRKDYDERLKGRTPLVAFVARLSDDDRSGRGAKQANLYERAANAGALIDKALPFAQRRDTARLCVAAYFAAKRAAAACDGPARRLAAPTPVALRTLVVAAVKAAVWRGLALSTASRSVTFGLRKFSEARAATENLATEAEQAKLKANAAFQFTQNSSGLLRSCADVFDEVVARKERARAIKNRTESAYNRLSAVHKQSLGTSVGDYEASTETLTAAAAGGGGIGDLPAAKPVKKILEALSSLLLIQAPSPEEGWELFIRTDFPKLVGEWYGRACKAAARDFEDDNDDTPGDTHAEKRHAWAHGVAQAERALADPSTVASSVRRMGQAGLAVGVPVSVWVRCCCAVWKALCVPQTLAAWASAQDARKADAAASEKHALELDAFEAAQVAEKAAKVAVVDARRFGAETDELAHELGRKHRTALGRFKEIESTLMRWDGRARRSPRSTRRCPRPRAAPPRPCRSAALPLGGSRRSDFVGTVRKLCRLPKAGGDGPLGLEPKTSRVSAVHVELPAAARALCAPLSDEDACDFGGSGDGGVPLRRWEGKGLLPGGSTGNFALGVAAVATELQRVPLLIDPCGDGARWLCGAFARPRPRANARTLTRVFLDATGGATVVAPTPPRGAPETRREDPKFLPGNEDQPALVSAIQVALKQHPPVVLVDLPDRCFARGAVPSLHALLEPLEPLLRARFDRVYLGCAEAPVARALLMGYSMASKADAVSTQITRQPAVRHGGSRLILRCAVATVDVADALCTSANTARHLISVVDLAPDITDVAKRLAAGAVAAATHGPFADVTKVARIQKEASSRRAELADAATAYADVIFAVDALLGDGVYSGNARKSNHATRATAALAEHVSRFAAVVHSGRAGKLVTRDEAAREAVAGAWALERPNVLANDVPAPAPVAAPPAAAPAASDVAAAPPAAAPAVPDVAAAPPADDEALRADDEALEAALPAILRDDGSLEPPDDASLDSQPWMAMMSQISLDVTGESTAALEASLPQELGGLCAAVRDEPAAWRDALEGGQAPQLFFVPSNSGPPEGLDPKFFAKRLLSCHERRVEEGERRKSFLDQMIEQEAEEARLKEERRRYEAGDYDASGDDEDEFGDLKEPSQFAKLLVLRAFRPDLVQKGAELVAASVLAEDGEPARLSAPGAWPPEDPPSLLRAPWVADRQAGTAASAAVALGAACLLAAPLEPVLVTVAADAEDDVFSLFPVVAAAAKTFMAEKNKGAYKASAPPRIAEVGLGSADANDAAATAVSEGRQWGRWVLVRHGELAGGWLPVLLAQLDACDIQRRDREVRKEERVAEQRAAGKGKREAAEAAEAQHEGKKDDSSPAPHDHHRVLIEVVVPPDWSGRGAGGLAPAFPCPRDLARRCGARVAFEPPRGVKARLVAALWDGGGSQSSARLYARLSDEHQRLYYAQVLLHALVRTRRDFGALGVVGRTTPGSAA